MQDRIPKRIIQTGKTSQQALKTRAMVTNLRLLNADFEYLFFDDAAVLRFFDDLTVPQIAAQLGIADGTVKRYLADASGRLAIVLAVDATPEETVRVYSVPGKEL